MLQGPDCHTCSSCFPVRAFMFVYWGEEILKKLVHGSIKWLKKIENPVFVLFDFYVMVVPFRISQFYRPQFANILHYDLKLYIKL